MKDQINNTWYNKALPLFGRLALSLIFIFSGVMKILNFDKSLIRLTEKGITWGTELLLILAILFEIGGGLLILLGWKTRLGCLLLIIFLVPTTLIFHDFWNIEGPNYDDQLTHFIRNISLIGGLALLASFGPGRWSVEKSSFQVK